MSNPIVVEARSIQVDRFRVKDGQPTCAAGPNAPLTCRFLAHRRFGTEAYCLLEGAPLKRDNGGVGYLIPHEACIVWGQE